MDQKSIDEVNNELRETFMQFKDLSARCLIDMEHIQKNDHRVFYFKPNSIFLEEPETQRLLFGKISQKISSLKDNQQGLGRPHLADQMSQEVQKEIIDFSLQDPAQTRQFFAEFFQRRIYQLQHQKFKLLTRWAHFALTGFSIDKLGQIGSFSFARLEYELENSVKRWERLKVSENYDELRDGIFKRPVTQEPNQNDYQERSLLEQIQEEEDGQNKNILSHVTSDPISSIRIDDFEVYLRIQTYLNKILRPGQKFITKAKWISTTQSINIFKEQHIQHTSIVQLPYLQQLQWASEINKRFEQSSIKRTEQVVFQFEEIMLEDYPANRIHRALQIQNQSSIAKDNKDQKKDAQDGQVSIKILREKCPLRVTNLIDLYLKLEQLSESFGIQGNVEIDGGFSFAYQINVMYITYCQKQVIESTFCRYDQLTRDPQQTYQLSGNMGNPVTSDQQVTKLREMIYQMSSSLRKIMNPSKSDVELLYEKFDGDFARDFSEVQKRNLKQLMFIDFMLIDLQNTNAAGNNLPLLKKGKKINEQLPDLQKVFGDCVVTRLKKAMWTQTQILVWPQISTQQANQDTTLAEEVGDLQLRAIIDFVDVSDPSIVSVIYNSFGRIYLNLAQETNKINYFKDEAEIANNEKQMEINMEALSTDRIAKQFYDTFTAGVNFQKEQNEFKQRINEEEIKEMKASRLINQDRQVVNTENSLLRKLPPHLIQSYLTLKHMQMRDNKNKLLKVLNFYRSIQKRICLDLKDFSNREISNNNQKVKIPTEAFHFSNIAGHLEEKLTSIKQQEEKNKKIPVNLNQKRKQEFEDLEDESISTLIDLKRYKFKGQFSNPFLQTCPMAFTIDATHEPPQSFKFHQSRPNQQMQTSINISEESLDYLNRMDNYVFDDLSFDIKVVDDFGVNIMYDASLQDMLVYEDYLVQLATYFIRKTEQSFDFDKFEYALVDRMEVLADLLKIELEYQFIKAQVITAYLDAFEHTVDPLNQMRLMQIIVDVIAWKVKLDIQGANYFMESYRVEIDYLKTMLSLLNNFISFQIDLEKKENLKVRDYLNQCFKEADAYANQKWTDIEAQNIGKEVDERQYIQNGMRQQETHETAQENLNIDQTLVQTAEGYKVVSSIITSEKITERANIQTSESKAQNLSKTSDKRKDLDSKRENKKTFAEELGIKAPDSKDQMMSQSPPDGLLEDAVNQDANFTKIQEGYAQFFQTENQSQLRFAQNNQSSQPFALLDFYQSLSSVPLLHAVIMQGQQELKQDLKPASPIYQNIMNKIYLEKLQVELIKIKQSTLIGGNNFYPTQQYLESDLVASNPEKLMFLLKDMISQMNKNYKRALNPFWISKLDLTSINNFSFPLIYPKAQMNDKNNQSPFIFWDSSNEDLTDVDFNRNFIETQIKPLVAKDHFFPKLMADDTSINIPPQLLIFCNLVEVLRIRERLVLSLVEYASLEECYYEQRKMINNNQFSTLASNDLSIFTNSVLSDDKQINFLEYGSLLTKVPAGIQSDNSELKEGVQHLYQGVGSGLAIDEICPGLRSNLNFQNPESVQTMCLQGGISNLLSTYHYQLINRQLLQTAVQGNQIIMSPYLKAIVEIDLLTNYGIRLTNGLIDYTKLIPKALQKNKVDTKYQQSNVKVGNVFERYGLKSLDNYKIKEMRNMYQSELSRQCQQNFFLVNKYKEEVRSAIKSKYEDQKSKLLTLGRTKKNSSNLQIFQGLLSKQLQPFTMAKILNDQKHVLVHAACRYLSLTSVSNQANKVDLLYLTQRELVSRLNFFGGLPPEQTIFRVDQDFSENINHPWIQIQNLKIFGMNPFHLLCPELASTSQKNDQNNEANTYQIVSCELAKTIPSKQIICQLPIYDNKSDPGIFKNADTFFRIFQNYVEHSQLDLDLISYKNLTTHMIKGRSHLAMIKAIMGRTPLQDTGSQAIPDFQKLLETSLKQASLFQKLQTKRKPNLVKEDEEEQEASKTLDESKKNISQGHETREVNKKINLGLEKFVQRILLTRKLVNLYANVNSIFEHLLFIVRGNCKPTTQIEMNDFVDAGRKFWRIDEANATSILKNLSENQAGEGGAAFDQNNEDYIVNQANRIEDESLSQKIVEQVMLKKRGQFQLYDDFIKVKKLFEEILSSSQRHLQSSQGKHSPGSLDRLVQIFADLNQFYHLRMFRLSSFFLDNILANNQSIGHNKIQEDKDQQIFFNVSLNLVRLFSGIDFQAPYFSNGFLLDQRIFSPQNINFQLQTFMDQQSFRKSIRGIKYAEDLVPPEISMILQLLEIEATITSVEDPKQIKNRVDEIDEYMKNYPTQYVGQLYFDQTFTCQLRNIFLGLTQKTYNTLRLRQDMFNQQFKNLIQTKEISGGRNFEDVQSTVKIGILEKFIYSQMLKLVFTIAIAGKTFPINFTFSEISQIFANPVNSLISGKVKAYIDAENLRQLRQNNEKKKELDSKNMMKQAEDLLAQSTQIALSESGNGNSFASDEALTHMQRQLALQRVVENDLLMLFMKAGTRALGLQTAAISKVLEMGSNKIEKHIPTRQGFAATLFDDVNRLSHLEVIQKLPALQLFLTKIRNRGLPIQTLTSGAGIVCTFKDLNECIYEFCLEMLQFSERQLKLRTDTCGTQIKQLCEIVQYKDNKIEALKIRLSYICDNIQRVINSKVFEQGQHLVFAMDQAMQKVRMYQENMSCYEEELSLAIKEQFRDLLEAQSQTISQKDKKLFDMHQNIINSVNLFIAQNQIEVEQKILSSMTKHKDLEDFANSLKEKELRRLDAGLSLDANQGILLEKQYQREKKDKSKTQNEPNSNLEDFNKFMKYATVMCDKCKEKLKNYKLFGLSVEDHVTQVGAAVNSVGQQRLISKLQDKMIMQRDFWELRLFSERKKFQDKISFLEQQMSKNYKLWEQLEVEKKVNQTLQSELSLCNRTAQENQRLVEKLKETLTKQEKDKQVLEALNESKAIKLAEIQYKVKDVDFSKQLNVPKLVELILKQEKKIEELTKNQNYTSIHFSKLEAELIKKNKQIEKLSQQEVDLKRDCMNQINELEERVKMYEMDSKAAGFHPIFSLDNQVPLDNKTLKQKFDELFKVSQELTKENQRLKSMLQSPATKPQTTQENRSPMSMQTTTANYRQASSTSQMLHDFDDDLLVGRNSFKDGNLFMSQNKTKSQAQFQISNSVRKQLEYTQTVRPIKELKELKNQASLSAYGKYSIFGQPAVSLPSFQGINVKNLPVQSRQGSFKERIQIQNKTDIDKSDSKNTLNMSADRMRSDYTSALKHKKQ